MIDTENEKWKFIEGTKELYKVSDLGNIYSVKTRIIRKAWIHKNYLTIQIRIYGVTKKLAVHRVVAQAFIPNPENKPEINHKNGIKTDNRAVNIEWCTGEENRLHAAKMGLIPKGVQVVQAKLTNEDVEQIRTLSLLGVSNSEIAPLFKITQANVYAIVNKATWKHLLPGTQKISLPA